MTNTQWRELGDIPPQYHPYFIGGENACCDGYDANSNPWPPFSNRHHAYRAGWWRQHNEIKLFGEIK